MSKGTVDGTGRGEGAIAFARLRSVTQARIGLGRAGHAEPTRESLDFQLAHARARDAVHAAMDVDRIRSTLDGADTIEVSSRAGDRAMFLQRPDLGRRLHQRSRENLEHGAYDLALVIGDGLSARAVEAHAAAMVTKLRGQLLDWTIAPVVLAHQSRVALADEIGEALGARLVVMLIGERPGLSAADSLGAYITWQPRVGRADSERNCVSNIRPPHGLSYEQATDLIVWLLKEAKRRGVTGVALKDTRTQALPSPE